MFQQMRVWIQLKLRCSVYTKPEIRGMNDAPQMPISKDRNVKVQHDESTGMGFSGPSMQDKLLHPQE
ncbi:MAG: hypothetical protein CM1200mP1_16340 [Candidatus Neomarinimicrobiota bacterium]|nr:MAG: hypothetical protein CM1200mP1_16340 [Candidatus Neomarinimicrobiota bacterium]